jgi:hypothetical protein
MYKALTDKATTKEELDIFYSFIDAVFFYIFSF